jgi:hypothetical protein
MEIIKALMLFQFMNKQMTCWLTFILLIFSSSISALEISYNEVYAQFLKIKQEVDILKQYFNITEEIQPSPVNTILFPRHTWQKSYEVLIKINIFREKLGLPVMAVASREPLLHLKPFHVYEQALRILVELDLLQFHLNIEEKSAQIVNVTDKTITDNFNLLNFVSSQLDLLNQESFTPSHVFAQAMRINEDVNAILEALEIKNSTIPPPQQQAVQPKNAFQTALLLLQEVNRVKKLVELENIDYHAFEIALDQLITPNEVFNLTGIILAELQPLKAYLQLKHVLTPTAHFYKNKTPAEVKQVLGWSVRKLKLIQAIK